MFDELFIVVEVVMVAIFIVIELKKLLYFFFYVISHNLQPFWSDVFVANPIYFLQIDYGSLDFLC
jgi:hypothetical protein